MKDDKIDMDAVCATLDEAVREANERKALEMLVPPTPPPPPKVVGIFDKKAVDVDAPMDPDVKSVLDQVVDIANKAGPNTVIGVGVFLLHQDGAMTRAFHVSTGNWCACLGAVEHLKWAMHSKYSGD